MIYIEKNVMRRNLNRARKYLTGKGILSEDGSGESSVETVFSYLTLILVGELGVRREKKKEVK